MGSCPWVERERRKEITRGLSVSEARNGEKGKEYLEFLRSPQQ